MDANERETEDFWFEYKWAVMVATRMATQWAVSNGLSKERVMSELTETFDNELNRRINDASK